jgi:cytochrome c peroxidase
VLLPVLLVVPLLLAGCGGGGGIAAEPGAGAGAMAQPLSAAARLGEQIFSDPSLSASGRQACASCHVPEQGHGQADGLPVPLGGPALNLQGQRHSPSIRYLASVAPFRMAADGTPSGGLFWDGRARNLQDQAGRPFLGLDEMANGSRAETVARLARAGYAADFQRVFGADIFSHPDEAFERLTLALQQYQLEDSAFRPFDSKYDAFLAGRASLTDAELRGLALFNSPAKGNCAACHPSARGPDGSPPLFTDFSYDALGVPRNAELARNADPAFFDLGLCAREAGDLAARTELCGAFKVPSLRNVALRRAYFHNGRFKDLRTVLSFYVLRDIEPERFYPRDADGTVRKFDDLPAAWRRNVNTREAPYGRRPGDSPALSEAEIDDVIAFLDTLTDGWKP